MNMFAVLSIIGLVVLVPINYYSNRPTRLPGQPYDEIQALRELTVENVPLRSPWLKAHLLCTWIFSFIA
jgi:hypothetical protein